MMLNIWKTDKNHRYLDSLISAKHHKMCIQRTCSMDSFLIKSKVQGSLLIFYCCFVVFLLLRQGFIIMQPRLNRNLLFYGFGLLSARIATSAWQAVTPNFSFSSVSRCSMYDLSTLDLCDECKLPNYTNLALP